jgi:uncharacterized protein (DUF2132 family)
MQLPLPFKGKIPLMKDESSPAEQPRNPLHGMTLEAIVSALQAHFGWEDLAQRIPIRCFTHDPSIPSSLKFLRKTPWARDKVESLYLFMLREKSRMQKHRTAE